MRPLLFLLEARTVNRAVRFSSPAAQESFVSGQNITFSGSNRCRYQQQPADRFWESDQDGLDQQHRSKHARRGQLHQQSVEHR